MACRVWVSRSAEEICEREFLRAESRELGPQIMVCPMHIKKADIL